MDDGAGDDDSCGLPPHEHKKGDDEYSHQEGDDNVVPREALLGCFFFDVGFGIGVIDGFHRVKQGPMHDYGDREEEQVDHPAGEGERVDVLVIRCFLDLVHGCEGEAVESEVEKSKCKDIAFPLDQHGDLVRGQSIVGEEPYD